MLISTELLRLAIAKAGGPTPPKGTSEDELRQRYRGALEVKLEAEEPLAGFDQRERDAWKGVPECQPATRS
jgi:hypothetical protein